MKYNIIQQVNILVWNAFIFFVIPLNVISQDAKPGKYGIYAIHDMDIFKETTKKDSMKQMTDLQSAIPGIVLDLRYASKQNFMHIPMYPSNTSHTFLRKPAAAALALVQKELNHLGYGIKVFDAYRPYAVTEKFWELVHDDRYVADPRKGSGHNRGIAIDLTIIELKSKKELNMPTGFDNFTDSAHHDFMNLSAEVLENRSLLKSLMEKYGFVSFPTEWWHYSLPNPERFEVLDLSFQQLMSKQ